jgi:hypothetical protein
VNWIANSGELQSQEIKEHKKHNRFQKKLSLLLSGVPNLLALLTVMRLLPTYIVIGFSPTFSAIEFSNSRVKRESDGGGACRALSLAIGSSSLLRLQPNTPTVREPLLKFFRAGKVLEEQLR